jgi:hypothetical protein
MAVAPLDLHSAVAARRRKISYFDDRRPEAYGAPVRGDLGSALDPRAAAV